MKGLGHSSGNREKEYHGENFHLHIDGVIRELISLIYTSEGTTLKLGGELIGRNWEGIQILIPPDVESNHGTRIAQDIAVGLEAMRYKYEIVRKTGEEVVPDAEREAAIVELTAMGFEIELSPDRKKIQIRKKLGAPNVQIETIRKRAPRMKGLLLAVHGIRPRYEILAKSIDL